VRPKPKCVSPEHSRKKADRGNQEKKGNDQKAVTENSKYSQCSFPKMTKKSMLISLLALAPRAKRPLYGAGDGASGLQSAEI
jgi:hypothetical protein